jgi:hypothetical protein
MTAAPQLRVHWFVWNFKKILRSLEPQASELNMILARVRGEAV